jgi:hypothetical protein
MRQYDDAAYENDISERASNYAARSHARRDDLKVYNQAIDERATRAASALKPFRHIGTIAEAGARNIAARAASALLASAASALASRNDAFDPGEVTDAGSRATPLGDAAPFEYGKRAAGDDVFSIAACGVSESHEAECHMPTAPTPPNPPNAQNPVHRRERN